MDANGWMPIESAPKKGSFLIYGGSWVGESDDGRQESDSLVAMVNRNGRPRFYIANSDEFWPWVEGPTHWRPLPPPPETADGR